MKPKKRKTEPKHPAPKKVLPIEPPKPDQQKPDARDVALQEAQRELRARDEEIQALKGELQTLKDQLQRQQMRSHEHQRLEAIRLVNHGGDPK